jgi:AraC family transcriptional regulator
MALQNRPVNIYTRFFRARLGEVSGAMIAPVVGIHPERLTTLETLDSADRSEMVRITLRSGGPGVVEVPELDVPRVVVYIGKPVRLDCRHGLESHCGLAVHGDIDIIPDRMASRWEMKGVDLALVIQLGHLTLRQVAEASGFDRNVEVRSRFRVRNLQIEHMAGALMAEAQNGYPGGRLYLDSMATALAVQLLRHHSSLPAIQSVAGRGMAPGKLRQIQAYIEENLRCDLSLDMIAKEAGMSSSHLKSTFRAATGSPIHQYVIRRRVERAALMLREDKLPIGQIAAEVGFAHQSHLALHTRRLLGVSPSQVRRLAA